MALNTEELKNRLIALQQVMKTKDEDCFEFWAEQMAQIMENYVKSGRVAIGIEVTTSGGNGSTTSEGAII